MKLQSPELEQRILDTTLKTGPGAGRENFARMVRKINTSPQWATCGVERGYGTQPRAGGF
jgi:hypothetical protein